MGAIFCGNEEACGHSDCGIHLGVGCFGFFPLPRSFPLIPPVRFGVTAIFIDVMGFG